MDGLTGAGFGAIITTIVTILGAFVQSRIKKQNLEIEKEKQLLLLQEDMRQRFTRQEERITAQDERYQTLQRKYDLILLELERERAEGMRREAMIAVLMNSDAEKMLKIRQLEEDIKGKSN